MSTIIFCIARFSARHSEPDSIKMYYMYPISTIPKSEEIMGPDGLRAPPGVAVATVAGHC